MNTIFNVVLYVLLGTYITFLVIFIATKNNHLKLLHLIFLPIFFVYAISRLIFIPIEYDYSSPSQSVLFYIVFALLVALIVVLPIIFDKSSFRFNTKTIAFAGISIATAYALSFIRIEFLGGSITLASALPIILFSYIYGAKKGVFVGMIFGVLQFIQKATIYHPIQVIIDYPVAFASIGLSGLFNEKNIKPILKFLAGAITGLFARYISHVISGYFVFGVYASYYGFTNPLLYSIVYNMNVLIDLALLIVVGVFLFSSKSFTNYLENQKI